MPPTLITLSHVDALERAIAVLKKQAQAEKDEEHVQFAVYKQFCQDTTIEKKLAIAEANEQIDVLKADIEKDIASTTKLSKEIAEHEEDISVCGTVMSRRPPTRGIL